MFDMNKSILRYFPPGALALGLLFSQCSVLGADSESFDNYATTADLTAGGWILAALNPALVTTTLPTVGAGKGLRVQANPIPGAAPAVGLWYRMSSYTDFVAAIDLTDWPGTSKNQAVVLFARMTDGETGTVVNNLNPAAAQGMICNYDASQYGENPGNRRQGQLQINVVNPGFATRTLAVAEITFEPGRSYRIVFQGVGTLYTAKAYDFNDLTRPLVTLEADDGTFTEGACGLLSFSRQDTDGTTDVTIDNYYAGPTDPNVAAAPALSHPIAGTPVVDTRVPAERFQNFHNPATGISFTAKTHGVGEINAAATKLWLNGVDVSGQLTVTGGGGSISASLPGSALEANKTYSGEIQVMDSTGAKSSKNTFWFDTFSEAYLSSAGVQVIEAEEYNYESGQFQADPIPVSGFDTNNPPSQINGNGVGYLDLVGVEGIDFHDVRTSAESPFFEFRINDPVGTLGGMYPEVQDANDPTGLGRYSDHVRTKYSANNMVELVVCRTEPGEWLNYTRNFSEGSYRAYLRVASFGATAVELHQVTSDATLPEQTTTTLGVFNIPNQIARYNYRYIPLVDEGGSPKTISLSGLSTVRLQMAGVAGEDVRKLALNYLLFVPAPVEPAVKLFASATVNGPYAEEPGATVDEGTKTIAAPITGSARFYKIQAGTAVTISSFLITGDVVTIKY